MRYLPLLLLSLACSLPESEPTAPATSPAGSDPYKIVFVTGDEEYRSEESMPMLARLVERELGVETEVLFAVDSAGIIDPNRNDHIAGLEALDSADLMVVFTRWRQLPAGQAKYITDFAESGRPMVGFRTATHTFKYHEDHPLHALTDDWPTRVFGQQWIVHHGHFDDGQHPLTDVRPVADNASPILNGVGPFAAYSWLYHVDGGDWKLHGDAQPLLTGRSLRSKQEVAGKLAEYPLTNPVAWTKTYTGSGGVPARVFFTTLGHPYDFKLPELRKLALNGIAWAAGRAEQIPPDGFSAALDRPYEPNNSGFGNKYKPGLRPADLVGR